MARAFTTVAGARSKEEFLDGLRRGLTVPVGRSGSWARLTSEVVRIFAAGYHDGLREAAAGRPSALRLLALLGLLPLLPLIPVVTALVHVHERRFGDEQFRAFEASVGATVRRAAATPAATAPARLRNGRCHEPRVVLRQRPRFPGERPAHRLGPAPLVPALDALGEPAG